MYGPNLTFNFTRGERYDLPTGYECSGGNLLGGSFHFGQYEYVGHIRQKCRHEEYLVFRNDDHYVFCAPHARLVGDRIDIGMNPQHFGSLDQIVAKIGFCEWETFISEAKLEDLPTLPGAKSEK